MADISLTIQNAASQHAELLKAISDTEYAKPAIQEQTRFLNDLNAHLKNSKQKIARLDAKRKSELKDHEKYRDSTMKRFVYRATGKQEEFDAKASKEEREYFDALHDQQTEEKLSENIQHQITEAQTVHAELEQTVRLHDSKEQELEQLYNRIFSGPTPQFPEEDDKENQKEMAKHAFQEARARSEAETRVVSLLTSSAQAMMMAEKAMGSAIRSSTMDMIGGGAMADMMERNALSQAERAVAQARMQHIQARQMSPHVGPLPATNIAQGNMLSDVLFDNPFSDYRFHAKIQKSQVEVQRLSQAVRGQLMAARDRVGSIQTELQRHGVALEQARKALQKAREQAFAQVLGGEVPVEAPAPDYQPPSEAPPAYSK